MNEKAVWLTDLATMMKVYELAQKRGKKTGDDIQQEFFEVMEQTNSNIKFISKVNEKNVREVTDKIKKELDGRKE